VRLPWLRGEEALASKAVSVYHRTYKSPVFIYNLDLWRSPVHR
jgi:hypothetical protein